MQSLPYIDAILRATDGDKARAAKLLGVSLSSLYRRLQRFEDQTSSSSAQAPCGTPRILDASCR